MSAKGIDKKLGHELDQDVHTNGDNGTVERSEKVAFKEVKFRFPEPALNNLDEMRDHLGATSRVEIIKTALALLQWTIEQRNKGIHHIGAVDEHNHVHDKIILPI